MRLYKIGLLLILIVGAILLLYPTVSEKWNAKRQSRALLEYDQNVQQLQEQERQKLLEEANRYNEQLAAKGETDLSYEQVLNIDGRGIMGYVLIPKIHVELPIYHGTSEAVLQKGVGHMEGTSLPVGGGSAHCVLSSHRGLPSARLFTDLDQLIMGDAFQLKVLNQVREYTIDQILVVEPHEMDALRIVKGQDYCTLVTCTPYGINSHRMLIRGRCTKVSTEDM